MSPTRPKKDFSAEEEFNRCLSRICFSATKSRGIIGMSDGLYDLAESEHPLANEHKIVDELLLKVSQMSPNRPDPTSIEKDADVEAMVTDLAVNSKLEINCDTLNCNGNTVIKVQTQDNADLKFERLDSRQRGLDASNFHLNTGEVDVDSEFKDKRSSSADRIKRLLRRSERLMKKFRHLYEKRTSVQKQDLFRSQTHDSWKETKGDFVVDDDVTDSESEEEDVAKYIPHFAGKGSRNKSPLHYSPSAVKKSLNGYSVLRRRWLWLRSRVAEMDEKLSLFNNLEKLVTQNKGFRAMSSLPFSTESSAHLVHPAGQASNNKYHQLTLAPTPKPTSAEGGTRQCHNAGDQILSFSATTPDVCLPSSQLSPHLSKPFKSKRHGNSAARCIPYISHPHHRHQLTHLVDHAYFSSSSSYSHNLHTNLPTSSEGFSCDCSSSSLRGPLRPSCILCATNQGLMTVPKRKKSKIGAFLPRHQRISLNEKLSILDPSFHPVLSDLSDFSISPSSSSSAENVIPSRSQLEEYFPELTSKQFQALFPYLLKDSSAPTVAQSAPSPAVSSQSKSIAKSSRRSSLLISSPSRSRDKSNKKSAPLSMPSTAFSTSSRRSSLSSKPSMGSAASGKSTPASKLPRVSSVDSHLLSPSTSPPPASFTPPPPLSASATSYQLSRTISNKGRKRRAPADLAAHHGMVSSGSSGLGGGAGELGEVDDYIFFSSSSSLPTTTVRSIPRLDYKEIPTPKWRVLQKTSFAHRRPSLLARSLHQQPVAGEEDEDTSNAAYFVRHEQGEEGERERFRRMQSIATFTSSARSSSTSASGGGGGAGGTHLLPNRTSSTTPHGRHTVRMQSMQQLVVSSTSSSSYTTAASEPSLSPTPPSLKSPDVTVRRPSSMPPTASSSPAPPSHIGDVSSAVEQSSGQRLSASLPASALSLALTTTSSVDSSNFSCPSPSPNTEPMFSASSSSDQSSWSDTVAADSPSPTVLSAITTVAATPSPPLPPVFDDPPAPPPLPITASTTNVVVGEQGSSSSSSTQVMKPALVKSPRKRLRSLSLDLSLVESSANRRLTVGGEAGVTSLPATAEAAAFARKNSLRHKHNSLDSYSHTGGTTNSDANHVTANSHSSLPPLTATYTRNRWSRPLSAQVTTTNGCDSLRGGPQRIYRRRWSNGCGDSLNMTISKKRNGEITIESDSTSEEVDHNGRKVFEKVGDTLTHNENEKSVTDDDCCKVIKAHLAPDDGANYSNNNNDNDVLVNNGNEPPGTVMDRRGDIKRKIDVPAAADDTEFIPSDTAAAAASTYAPLPPSSFSSVDDTGGSGGYSSDGYFTPDDGASGTSDSDTHSLVAAIDPNDLEPHCNVDDFIPTSTASRDSDDTSNSSGRRERRSNSQLLFYTP